MIQQEIEIKATPKQCYDVITDYESYPEFIKDLTDVTVAKAKGKTCEVTYSVNLLKSITYTLKMKHAPDRIDWEFVKGDIIKDNHGYWTLEEIKKGVTLATYNIDVKFGLLVPSSVVTALMNKNLPEMLKAFKKRIESTVKKK